MKFEEIGEKKIFFSLLLLIMDLRIYDRMRRYWVYEIILEEDLP